MMTRRRTPISIYDYPEHLNPFREDVDEGEDVKYHTTGRRRSSFRTNAWAVFAGRGKSPERSTPSPVASRFLTWTPKLLRRASFRRMITPTTQAPPEHKNALSPPPRTLPARPPIPTHINCTSNSSPAPVPAVRTRRLSQRAGGEDETKYIQQGAKPKKKRRAPAPPTPQPGRALQPQEPEASCSTTREQYQSSGGPESATSAECYIEQSRTSPAESEETSVISSEAATEVQLAMTQSNSSLAASEEPQAENRESSGQLMNESAPVVSEDPTEVVSQSVVVEPNSSQTLPESPPAEEKTEEKEVTIAEQSALDIDNVSNSQSITEETKIVQQEEPDTTENNVNEVPSANEVEPPVQGNTEMEDTREVVEEVSVSSTEETSVTMENRSEESPRRTEETENSNSLTDVKEDVNNQEEPNHTPLENGFSGSDSEISPSKTSLIEEESKPLPKPRTILPEKPTEQDKKP